MSTNNDSEAFEAFMKTFTYILFAISFAIYLFIIIVNVVSKEKLTIYKFFKLQTVIFSILYTIGNFNFAGSNKNIDPNNLPLQCIIMGNVRNISIMTIISIQTLILVFIYASLQYPSYTENNINKIYIWLYLIPHVSWIIMVLTSLHGGYEPNVYVGQCKYDSPITMYYRTVLYVLHAIVCVVLFIRTIKVIKTSQVNSKLISLYVKSFVLYFSVLFVYLLSYLTITVIMVLGVLEVVEPGVKNAGQRCVWVLRIITQTLTPIIVSCLNCLSKGKVINLLNLICGDKCGTLLLRDTDSFKEVAKGSKISMKMMENKNMEETDDDIDIDIDASCS